MGQCKRRVTKGAFPGKGGVRIRARVNHQNLHKDPFISKYESASLKVAADTVSGEQGKTGQA
jgi:hypothetical protein